MISLVFHPLFIISIIILSAVILLNIHVKWWIKVAAFMYYVLIFLIFHRKLITFEKQSKNTLSIKEYRDKNSDFVDGFMPFFAFPVLALIIYCHYSWFVHADNRNDRLTSVLTVFITGTFWFFFTFFISMHGYRP